MTNDIAIKVRDLHKSFDIAENRSTSIKHLFVNRGSKEKKNRQKVLDGIDFEIKKGDFFGIVGRNGSGKSTLLKLLAGVYTPDSGSIEVNGNLTPFIELGVGFNPELSGRDNVYLSASLLGFTRKQVDAIYDEIVDFAELHEHMDKMLKNYSSGMQVRLAFSIAVKAKNDILIFDEVLAVGDEAFQRKCMTVFEEYRKNKQTVILVTHGMETVRSLCTRALMLVDGEVKVIGDVDKVSDEYLKINAEEDSQETTNNFNLENDNRLVVTGCKPNYMPMDVMDIRLQWPNELPVKKVGVAIIRENGEYIFDSNTGKKKVTKSSVDYSVNLNIGPGRYSLTVAIFDHKDRVIIINQRVNIFTVLNDHRNDVGGIVRLKHAYSQD